MKYSLRSLMILAILAPPLLAFIFFAVLSSLSDPLATGLELVPVEGVVRLNGKPVAGVMLSFVLDEGDVAVGITDNSGEFRLTFSGYPGCPPQSAKVVVSSVGALAPGGVNIPARYTNLRQTPLTATPHIGKSNYITLDLSSP